MKFLISLLFLVSITAQAADPVFLWRADNSGFAARINCNTTTALQEGSGVISYDTDATAINGHNANMDQSAGAVRQLSWNVRGCIDTKAYSVCMRIKNSLDSLIGYYKLGIPGDISVNNYTMYQNSSAYQMIMFNDAGSTIKNGSATADPSINQWDDVCVTWDGTTTANKLMLWVNGVSTAFTASAAAPTTPKFASFSIGGITAGVPNARYLVEELAVWNSEILPTSVALESGTGSLNGPSRTSLIAGTAFNGGSNAGPGAANILSTASQTIAGVTTAGTYVIPSSIAVVKTGITYGASSGLTGTYDGSDRWTCPIAGNLLTTAADLKCNNTATNLTGTFQSPTVAQVQTGVTYAAGGASTGTYTGADRNSDPGATNVKAGVQYKVNSTSNNTTGSLKAGAKLIIRR